VGSIPATLYGLTQLEELHLGPNLLSDGFDERISNLASSLGEFTVGGYSTMVPLPETLYGLTGLTLLDVSHSNFTGSIPPDLANLSLLEELVLNNNTFTGSIPDALGALTELRKYMFSNVSIFCFLRRHTHLFPPGNLQLHGNLLVGNITSPSICDRYPEDLRNVTSDCAVNVEGGPVVKCTCCKLCYYQP